MESVVRRTCQVCHKVFTQASSLVNHMRIHTNERPYVCSQCGRCFIQKVHLKRHCDSKHAVVRQFPPPNLLNISAPAWGPGEEGKEDDDAPEIIHEIPASSTAPETPRKVGQKDPPNLLTNTFSGQVELLHHMFNGQEEQNMPSINTPVQLTCDTCHKQYSDVAALDAHMRRHTGKKPITCDHCGLLFSQPSNFTKHLLTHSESRFPCQFCRKTFTTSRALKVHVRGHTGERPFECKFCPRRFIQRVHLLRHELSHRRVSAPVSTNQPAVPEEAKQQSDVDLKGEEVNWAGQQESNIRVHEVISVPQETARHPTPPAQSRERAESRAPCSNCTLLSSELQLMKTELGNLKQFLTSKLTLMEQKIDNLNNCLQI